MNNSLGNLRLAAAPAQDEPDRDGREPHGVARGKRPRSKEGESKWEPPCDQVCLKWSDTCCHFELKFNVRLI